MEVTTWLVALLIGVLALAGSPSYAAISQDQCRPIVATNKNQCLNKIPQCLTRHKILLKWTGQGCRLENKKFADGGCQCDQYCGYRCRKACVRDSQCKWLTGKCYNKISGELGSSMPYCTSIPCLSRNTEVDVLWAVDESSSVAESGTLYNEMKMFVQSILRTEEKVAERPDLGTSKHGLLEFAGVSYFTPDEFFDIGVTSDFTQPRAASPFDFIQFVKTMQARGGFTRTDVALDYAKQVFLSSSDPSRRRVLILMTDGLPTDQYGFPGLPAMMTITNQAASDLKAETKSSIVLVRTNGNFPTGNETDFLSQYVSSSIDFQQAKSSKALQQQLYELIYPCLDA